MTDLARPVSNKPVLSRLTQPVQITLPHTLRDRWAEMTSRTNDYAKAPHRTRPPIIVLGFNKTGTTSLHHWFKQSGIRALHHGGHRRKNNVAMRIARNVQNGRGALDGFNHYEAFSDLTYTDHKQSVNGNAFFRELYQDQPDAYFILNHRSTEAWVKSRRGHGSGSLLERTRRIHGLTADAVEDLWRDLHRDRLAEIRAFFADKTARFLDVEMNDAASGSIAAFLAPEYTLDPERLQHRNRNKSIASAPSLARGDARKGDLHNG